MLLHKLTDDPDWPEVEAAITRARQAVAMYRHLGDEVLSVLSERAMNAALEVRAELLKLFLQRQRRGPRVSGPPEPVAGSCRRRRDR